MAGTIVADTLQDGAGNSTAMDNAIYGSAKAWVRFDGQTGSTTTVKASYNVSSVTYNGTGDYTVNTTTALIDANFSITGTCSYDVGSNYAYILTAPFGQATTSSTVRFKTSTYSAAVNCLNVSIALFR